MVKVIITNIVVLQDSPNGHSLLPFTSSATSFVILVGINTQ